MASLRNIRLLRIYDAVLVLVIISFSAFPCCRSVCCISTMFPLFLFWVFNVEKLITPLCFCCLGGPPSGYGRHTNGLEGLSRCVHHPAHFIQPSSTLPHSMLNVQRVSRLLRSSNGTNSSSFISPSPWCSRCVAHPLFLASQTPKTNQKQAVV